MATIIPVTWADVNSACDAIAARNPKARSVYGVPTGGAPVAVAVATRLGVPLVESPQIGTLVVDDLVDTGATLRRYDGLDTDACFRKPTSPTDLAPDAVVMDGWLTFPWERDEGHPTDAVVRLLEYIGEDPTREGLVDTPRRVLKAFKEMTAGYAVTNAESLSTVFHEPHDEMVVLTGIQFTSLCEHHLLPFHGQATVGYIPDGKIVGLSKLARVVTQYAQRLQNQERITMQVANAVQAVLAPIGVGVVLEAHHACMSCRGVRQAHTSMVTSVLRGVMREDPAVRAEFMALHGRCGS